MDSVCPTAAGAVPAAAAPPEWATARRLLAVQVGAEPFGTLGPALGLLRRGLPGAHLTLLAPAVDAAAGVLGCDAVVAPDDLAALVRAVEAVGAGAMFVFTAPGEAPWGAAYAGCLAGVPHRIGASAEFGGRVLTQTLRPAPAEWAPADRHLALLVQAGIAADPAVRVARTAAAGGHP